MSGAAQLNTEKLFAGKYRIIKLLGRGGMAEVYLVVKVADGVEKFYAQKRILPQYVGDETRVSAFLDEIRLAAQLDHENVIQVHDWGRDHESGVLYLTMEFVKGLDLAALGAKLKRHAQQHARALYEGQDRGLLPLEVALWVCVEALIGLDYLHRQNRAEGEELGLVHRDISPHNIMVDIRGRTRVTDLGISKALIPGQQHASSTQHSVGKPHYMPPEQWRGQPVDGTSDLYAWAISLLEITTGKHPYADPLNPNEDPFAFGMRVMTADPPPMSVLAPELPRPIQEVLTRLIKRDPAQRERSTEWIIAQLKQTIAALGFDLHQAKERSGRLVKLVYERPDTIAEMPGYRESSGDASGEALASPDESAKRPIRGRSENGRRTMPLAPEDPPASPPAPSAPEQPLPRAGSPKLVIALAGAVILLLGIIVFGAAFYLGGIGDQLAGHDDAPTRVGNQVPEPQPSVEVAARHAGDEVAEAAEDAPTRDDVAPSEEGALPEQVSMPAVVATPVEPAPAQVHRPERPSPPTRTRARRRPEPLAPVITPRPVPSNPVRSQPPPARGEAFGGERSLGI